MPNMKARWKLAKKAYAKAAGQDRPAMSTSQTKTGIEPALKIVDDRWKRRPELEAAYAAFLVIAKKYGLVLKKAILAPGLGGIVRGKQITARKKKVALMAFRADLAAINAAIQARIALLKAYEDKLGEIKTKKESLVSLEGRWVGEAGLRVVANHWGTDRVFRQHLKTAATQLGSLEMFDFIVAISDKRRTGMEIYEALVDPQLPRPINVAKDTRQRMRDLAQGGQPWDPMFEAYSKDTYWSAPALQLLGRAITLAKAGRSRPRWYTWALERSEGYRRAVKAYQELEEDARELKRGIAQAP